MTAKELYNTLTKGGYDLNAIGRMNRKEFVDGVCQNWDIDRRNARRCATMMQIY